MPEAVMIAGANGAGKTTFARQIVPTLYPGISFLNADEIQVNEPSFAHPMAAGRELLRRLDKMELRDESFVIETTLSSVMYARRIKSWRGHGFRVSLHFIDLPSDDFAVERVARRVAAGGHWVPDDDVRRRFTEASRFFIRSTSLRWMSGIIGSATTEALDLSTITKNEPPSAKLQALLEAARRATWDALYGPKHLRSGKFRPSESLGAAQPRAAQPSVELDKARGR